MIVRHNSYYRCAMYCTNMIGVLDVASEIHHNKFGLKSQEEPVAEEEEEEVSEGRRSMNILEGTSMFPTTCGRGRERGEGRGQ